MSVYSGERGWISKSVGTCAPGMTSRDVAWVQSWGKYDLNCLLRTSPERVVNVVSRVLAYSWA